MTNLKKTKEKKSDYFLQYLWRKYKASIKTKG